MKADHVNVSWDATKRKWLVRVEIGAEVIRRYCDKPKDADEQTLRTAAAQTVTDEGYEFELNSIAVRRSDCLAEHASDSRVVNVEA